MVDLIDPKIVEVDVVIAITSFLAGLLVNFKKIKNLAVFLQATVLLLKMARHFYNTHPEGKLAKKSTNTDELVEQMHTNIVGSDQRSGSKAGPAG